MSTPESVQIVQKCTNKIVRIHMYYEFWFVWFECDLSVLFLSLNIVSLEKTHYFIVKGLTNATGCSCDIWWEPLWNDDKNKH